MSAAISGAAQASRFTTTLFDILDRVEYRRVSPAEQFDEVYRLRYEAYRREEFVPLNPQEIVRDEFDELANCYCYGVYIDGRLVSSLRFHWLTRAHRDSLSRSVFPDVIDPLLDRGASILDPGRFTADYESSLAYPALPFLTLRIATMAVMYFAADYVLNAVRPEHGAFYRRVFRSYQLADARFYKGLTFPITLYACDISQMYADLLRRYPFFRSTEEERRDLFGDTGRTGLIRPTARQAQRIEEARALSA
jgi:hypothetical protein